MRHDNRAWVEDAACLGTDPELYFCNDADTRGIAAAKAVCRRCPVRAQCLADALRLVDSADWGIWGGTTAAERQAMRRNARGPSASFAQAAWARAIREEAS